jgi:hypothetical protein
MLTNQAAIDIDIHYSQQKTVRQKGCERNRGARNLAWMNGRRKLAPTGVKCVCVTVPSGSTDGQDTPQITDIAEEELYYVRQRYFFFNVGDHIVSSFLRCRSSGNDMPPPGGRPAMRSCSQRLEWCADCGVQHTKGEYSSRQ